MRINLRVLLVLATAMLAVHGATAAFAQSDAVPQGKPGENGRQTPGDIGQTLDASLSLTAAYDDDLSVATAAATNLLGPQLITHSNQLLGNGRYQWRARDVQFRADGNSTWVHDRQTGRVSGLSHAAAANFTARLPRRMTLLLDQTMTYTGSPLYSLFPSVAPTDGGEARSTAPDSGADDVHAYSYTAQATLEQALTRRSSLSVSASAEHGQTVRRSTTEDQSELAAYGMSTRFARVMTRNSRASVRYVFRAGLFPDASSVAPITALTLGRGVRIAEQRAEIGMTWGRPLSATRRMVFDVVLGGAVLSPLDQPLTGRLRLTDSYRLVGQGGATFVFGRTWQAGATYRHGVDYVPGLVEPVLTDGFNGRLEGVFNRRVNVQAAAGYASGTSALIRGGAAFDTYTSDVRLNVALGRAVSTYVQYVYYLYDFRRYAPLVPGIPPGLERNGLRAGFTLSVPTLEW